MKTLCIDAFGARLLFSWEQLYNPFPAGGEIGQIIGPQKWLDKGYVIVPWRVTNPTYKGPSASGSTYKGPKKTSPFWVDTSCLSFNRLVAFGYQISTCPSALKGYAL